MLICSDLLFLRGGQSEETLFQSEDEHNSGPHMVQRCVYIRISVSCESCKATLVQPRRNMELEMSVKVRFKSYSSELTGGVNDLVQFA